MAMHSGGQGQILHKIKPVKDEYLAQRLRVLLGSESDPWVVLTGIWRLQFIWPDPLLLTEVPTEGP